MGERCGIINKVDFAEWRFEILRLDATCLSGALRHWAIIAPFNVSLLCQFVHESCTSFLEPIDGSVRLHGRDEDVEDPEEDEHGGSDSLDGFGTTELSTDSGMSSQEEDTNGEKGFNHKNGHGETQVAGWHLESTGGSDNSVVDGSHGPCDTNTQEHVDSVGTGYVTHGGIGSLVLDSGSLGGEGIWN